jgi:DNA modification methylase
MIEPYYEENEITIYHGDCRDILPELEPVDLVLTDPPYGIGAYSNGTMGGGVLARQSKYTATKWDYETVEFDLLMKFINLGGKSIIWGGNYYHLEPSPCWLVWDKDNGKNYFADCELAWTNLKQAVRIKKYRWQGMLQQPGRAKEKRLHPTQKPTEVIAWCISQADKHGTAGTILDPFMGSGTTLVAAKNLGRKAIGIELEEKYCEIAVKRLAQGVLPI